jgi:hypothetical protein
MASRGVHHSSVAQDLEDIEKNCREDAMILGHRPSHRHKKENMSHHTTSSAATQVQEESSMSLRRHGSPTHQHTTSAESANKTLHTLDDAGPDSIMVDKGDGMSYMLQGTRPTHPVPDEARPRRPPLHLPMPEFDEAHPEDLKNRKSTEKDKQVIDDFESDLRSLSSDSGHGRRHLRRVNCWHKLSPFMRSLIMAILGFVLFIVPCVLINAFVRISSGEESRSEYSVFQKYTAIDWLSWLGFMWVIAVITHFCIDRVPRLVIQFNHLIWGVCTEKTKGRIEYFVAIKFYIKILIFFSWAWGSYVIVMKVFPSSPYLTEDDIAQGLTWHEPFYYRTIYRIFSALFYGSLLLLVEKMILQIIAIRFHRTAYRDRIRTNKREIKMLDRLCEGARHIRRLSQSPAQMTGTQNSGASTPAWFGHSTKASESWHPQRETPGSSSKEHANGSYFPAHKRQPSQQHLISALNRKLQYIAMADQPEMQTKRMDYNSNYNARKLARWLYETLTQGNSRELVVEDFLLCFDTEEEAKEAFALFDRDNNGDISRRELRDVVVRIYKERKDLAAALRDLSQCVGKLDNILMSIAVIIYIFMVLNIVAEETISSVVVPFGSLLVTLSFIFGQSAKNTFDSIIYVFVTVSRFSLSEISSFIEPMFSIRMTLVMWCILMKINWLWKMLACSLLLFGKSLQLLLTTSTHQMIVGPMVKLYMLPTLSLLPNLSIISVALKI